ncbi:hypothetical protein HGRIS_008778 [Hohenbuehelia grisea]|uniref:C2 domain-containing protein n=1 Tax=Hohenbuehelia grisea TaxID=104357 RepID=A0ABR3J9M6_9AGAR
MNMNDTEKSIHLKAIYSGGRHLPEFKDSFGKRRKLYAQLATKSQPELKSKTHWLTSNPSTGPPISPITFFTTISDSVEVHLYVKRSFSEDIYLGYAEVELASIVDGEEHNVTIHGGSTSNASFDPILMFKFTIAETFKHDELKAEFIQKSLAENPKLAKLMDSITRVVNIGSLIAEESGPIH